ncbi:Urease, partial [Coemansia sp. RSA 2320]
MKLLPREVDKLTLVQTGLLAQRRLSRGVRLNASESTALLATVLLELIRDGRHSVSDLQVIGQHILGFRHVMASVPQMVHEVQIEGTFPDGTFLVTVHNPVCSIGGDLRLALYGSGLQVGQGGDRACDIVNVHGSGLEAHVREREEARMRRLDAVNDELFPWTEAVVAQFSGDSDEASVGRV